MKRVTNYFTFLNPKWILQCDEKDLFKSPYDFIQFYKENINNDFTRQMICLKSYLNGLENKSNLKSIKNLANHIIQIDLASSFQM